MVIKFEYSQPLLYISFIGENRRFERYVKPQRIDRDLLNNTNVINLTDSTGAVTTIDYNLVDDSVFPTIDQLIDFLKNSIISTHAHPTS